MIHALLLRGSLLVTLGAALAGCTQGRTAPTALRLDLAPGSTYVVDYTTTRTQNFEHDSDDDGETVSTTYSLTCRERAADGTMAVTLTLDDFRFESGGGKDRSTYDSRKGGEPPGHAMVTLLSALRGVPIRATLSPRAEVSGIDSGDAVGRVLSAFGSGTGFQLLERIALGARLDLDTRQKLQQIFPTYPAAPVDVGDSWTAHEDLALHPMLKVQVEGTYTVRSRNDGAMTIEATGAIRASPGAVIRLPHGRTAFDLKGERTGTLVVDEATGLITSGHLAELAEGAQIIEPGTRNEFRNPTRIRGTVVVQSRAR